MNSLRFLILDVFAETKYAGNQLGVFLDAGGMSTEQMQTLTRELNFAESTFILSREPRDGGYDVRIFTPREEMPFAGHPTLGTAFAIQQEILCRQVERVVLNLKVGQIPVTFSYVGGEPDILWMQQKPPVFGVVVAAEPVAAMLGLSASDIDTRFPIQEVSTGLPSLLIPIRSLAAVRKAHTIREKYNEFIAQGHAKSIFLFCPEPYDSKHHLNARMFADYYGVPEDPATGSANGCLAGYLVKHRFFGSDRIEVTVEQGYEIKRPSLLYLRAHAAGDAVDVAVGGRVKLAARCELA